jgi:hypothetical protein
LRLGLSVVTCGQSSSSISVIRIPSIDQIGTARAQRRVHFFGCFIGRSAWPTDPNLMFQVGADNRHGLSPSLNPLSKNLEPAPTSECDKVLSLRFISRGRCDPRLCKLTTSHANGKGGIKLTIECDATAYSPATHTESIRADREGRRCRYSPICR